MDCSVKKDLVEKLIVLHQNHIDLVYPQGFDGIFGFRRDHQSYELSRLQASNQHKVEFYRTVVSLDAQLRSEIVALMFLGKEEDTEAHHFPELLEKAKRMNGNGADYLFSKAELSHFLREGMKKLGWD